MRPSFLPALLLLSLPLLSLQAAPEPPAPPVPSVRARVDAAFAEKTVHERLTKLADLGGQLSAAEVPEALKIAAAQKVYRDGAVLRDAALRRWTDLEPAKALAFLLPLPEGRVKSDLLAHAAALAVKEDAPAAAASVAAMPAGPSRIAGIEAVAEAWSALDGKAAMAWAKSLPALLRALAYNRVLFTWVHLDPAAIAPEIPSLPPGDTRNSMITNVASDWALRDPHAASAWAMTLPDGTDRLLGLSNVATAWADNDPRAAAAYALGLPPGEIRARACAGVASRWATQDPRAAGDWLAKKCDPAAQRYGFAELMNFWAMIEPKAAGEWVRTLSGPGLQAASSAYVDAASFWAPDSAARVALLLAEPGERSRKFLAALRRWNELDPAAARAWLDKGHSIPDDLRQQGLAEIPVPPQG